VPILPDVLEPGLNVVFCGTAPSEASRARGAYYAHPGNRFWPTLAAIGLTPHQLRPEEYTQLPAFGIGLTDVSKTASGQDATLRPHDFDRQGLRLRIELAQPRFLAFTSKRAAREFLGRAVDYGPQAEKVGATALFVLPSTSGLATRFWDERWWRELAAACSRELAE
jgi:TDG/mug DNA glycosylase family protein